MLYRIAAETVVVVHLLVVIFILGGSLLMWRWQRVVWLHAPLVLWGTLIHFTGWVCPLTPLENYFRLQAGLSGYEESFIEYYILPLLDTERSQEMQILVGVLVLTLNILTYGVYFWVKAGQRGNTRA